jgi:hypothetical protein
MLRTGDDEAWVQKAWDDFEERSRQFYRKVPRWFDWEREMEVQRIAP